MQDPSQEDIKVITNCVSPLVTNDMNDELDTPFTEADVQKVLFDLNPNKAPGPDGYSASFFQKEWNIIRADVVKTILAILNNGDQLQGLNSTIIT